MKISILDLDKALVLEALYDGALYQAAKFDTQPAIREAATRGEVSSPFVKRMLAYQFIKEKTLSSGFPKFQFGTIDLGAGPRELAVDLSHFEIDVSEYNELHGEGAAQKIISKMHGEPPKVPEPSKVMSEEKNIFYAVIQDNADWLQLILSQMVHIKTRQDEKEREFIADLDKIISEHKIQEKYEKEPEQAIYVTWVKMLDPRLDQQSKEQLCNELAQRYIDGQSGQTHKISIGGTLSYMPSIITAPILLYSPRKVLSAYYEYQEKYGKYSHKIRDKNFETTLKVLLDNGLFPKQAKTFFLKKIAEMLKQRMQQSYFRQDDPEYLLHQAMASWEKNSLTTLVSENFDKELQIEQDKFKEKLQKTLENTDTDLKLDSEFGSLVFEKLLIEYKYNAETLNPIVVRFNNDNDLHILAAIYTTHGLNTSEMFKRHLVQLAKSTNEPGHYKFSSIFFSTCFKYLKEGEAKSIAPTIASFLSAEYYAEHSHSFGTIQKEMFTFWLEQQPDKIIDIIKAILGKPKGSHETPIDKFFSDLSYTKMPSNFYDKLSTLLSNSLTPEQFIRVYAAAPEEIQCKLLSALFVDEGNALIKLKQLSSVYETGGFSATFPRKIASQLKTINPKLYKQAENEKLFVEEEAKDDLETDVRLLHKILANESLTHDERRTEMHKLKNLHAAFQNAETGACSIVMKMFDSIPQKYWPDLFTYFDAQIIHWSFPHDEHDLELYYPEGKERPAPRPNTWLFHQTQWEDILYGTLVAILADFSKGERFSLRNNVAHWALSSLDGAFKTSASHFPGMVNKVLKKFFLENAPNSIKVFTAINDQFRDKYHAPEYFSHQGVYSQVASWLPEDTVERTALLAKLLQVDKGFEPALHTPFVRNKEEIVQTALRLINTRTEHIVNLFERLSVNIQSTVFKSLNQFDGEGFLRLLQIAFSDIGKGDLPMPYYMRTVVMLLSLCKNAHIDIFKIIDAAPNNEFFLKAFSNIEAWEKSEIYSYPYELMFSTLLHYQPEQLQHIVFEHIQQNIKKNDLFTLCSCIQSAKKITDNKFVLPEQEETILVDYLTQHMPGVLDRHSDTEIGVMAGFVPNFDKLILGLMVKAVKDQDELSSNHKGCLNKLVEVYSFSHINAMCLDLDLTECSAYLVENFSKFPDILRQTEEAVELYASFFDEHQYKMDSTSLWSFYNNLRSTIAKTAKESKTMTLDINVGEVCANAGIPTELVALMPPLKIKSSRSDTDEPSVTSLMADSWKKSGLITSPSSSTSISKKEKAISLTPI